MNELPKPPAPDTHCWDDDARLDVWSHSAYQLNLYGAECYRKVQLVTAKITFDTVKQFILNIYSLRKKP